MSFESFFKSPVVIIGGIHGDERAGAIAADGFKDDKRVIVISHVNKSGKRRLGGRDLNRHFNDTSGPVQKHIISQILDINPRLVIDLHEDDKARGVYAYCSQDIAEKLQNILQYISMPLEKCAYGDKTDRGVIVNGKQPFPGTLERMLEKIGVPYCTLETPMSYPFEERVKCLQQIVGYLL